MFPTIPLFFSAQHSIAEVDLRDQHHPCFNEGEVRVNYRFIEIESK